MKFLSNGKENIITLAYAKAWASTDEQTIFVCELAGISFDSIYFDSIEDAYVDLLEIEYKGIKSFVLEGSRGTITNGWVQWETIGCWFDSLADCGLKRAALNAN